MTRAKVTTPLCHCNSQKPFNTCCGPIISGNKKALTPEELMRSRYTAFHTKNIEHLINTRYLPGHGPDSAMEKTAPKEVLVKNERQILEKTCQSTQWLSLKVIASGIDKTNTHSGYVEFAAFYQTLSADGQTGRIGQLHEKSNFIQEHGAWYYTDGRILPPLTFKRNEPCWCQSGKKYKRCHGQ